MKRFNSEKDLKEFLEEKYLQYNNKTFVQFDPIKIWQKYTTKKVSGFAINSGHFIPEQNPKETINKLKNFFLKK